MRFRELHALRPRRSATWGFAGWRISFLFRKLVGSPRGRFAVYRCHNWDQNVSQRSFSFIELGKPPGRLDRCFRNGDQGASCRFAARRSANRINRSSLRRRVDLSFGFMADRIIALVSARPAGAIYVAHNAQQSDRPLSAILHIAMPYLLYLATSII